MNINRNCPKSRIHLTIDWKYTNTELAYKENLLIENEKSSTKKKLNHLYSSSLDIKEDSEAFFSNLSLKQNQENSNNHHSKVSEISKILEDKFGSNNPK